MAGDKLDEPNKESAEAKEALSRSARNKQIREENARNPELAAAKRAKVPEGYDLEGYTDEQIAKAFQGDEFGDKDYARLTGKPVGDDSEVKIPETPKDEDGVVPNPGYNLPEDPIGSIDPVPTPGPTQGITFPGSGGQNVNQNNDIISNVTGDNNNVNNNQDNSINAYGGDAQRFTNDYIRKFTSRYS